MSKPCLSQTTTGQSGTQAFSQLRTNSNSACTIRNTDDSWGLTVLQCLSVLIPFLSWQNVISLHSPLQRYDHLTFLNASNSHLNFYSLQLPFRFFKNVASYLFCFPVMQDKLQSINSTAGAIVDMLLSRELMHCTWKTLERKTKSLTFSFTMSLN